MQVTKKVLETVVKSIGEVRALRLRVEFRHDEGCTVYTVDLEGVSALSTAQVDEMTRLGLRHCRTAGSVEIAAFSPGARMPYMKAQKARDQFVLRVLRWLDKADAWCKFVEVRDRVIRAA